MAEIGVRAVEDKEVREPVHGDAEIGFRAVVPLICDRHAIAADHVDRPAPARRFEPCGKGDHVVFMHLAVYRFDALRHDLRDVLGDKVDIRFHQRGEIVV